MAVINGGQSGGQRKWRKIGYLAAFERVRVACSRCLVICYFLHATASMGTNGWFHRRLLNRQQGKLAIRLDAQHVNTSGVTLFGVQGFYLNHQGQLAGLASMFGFLVFGWKEANSKKICQGAAGTPPFAQLLSTSPSTPRDISIP